MMDRSPRRRLALALLALGLWALAGSAAAAVPPVRLVAPGPGAALVAGSTATLEWASLGNLRQKPWEEWEAFLSLDGGATYPVRITPHLDLDLRRVTFKVPAFPTRQGRLLLRLGDERQETAFELPQLFTIAANPAGWNGLDLAFPSLGRGEPARPGEPGVLSWVEGSRHGGPTREVVAADPPRAVPGVSRWADAPALLAVAAPAPPSGEPAAEPGDPAPVSPPPVATAATPRPSRPAAADLLALLKRRNE